MDVYPPNEVFEYTPHWENPDDDYLKATGASEGLNWIRTVTPPEGGMYSFFQGHPLPRKGHLYPPAVKANNQVKKITLALLYPYTSKGMRLPIFLRLLLPGKREFLEDALNHYWKTCDSIYLTAFPIPYLKEQYYKHCGREVWRFINYFFNELGINNHTSYQVGKVAATLIEYEPLYQLVMEDLLNETSKEKLLANPRKELLKLIVILKRRVADDLSPLTIGGKFLRLISFMSLLLWLPKIKRIFRKVLNQIDFRKLQMDDGDAYYSLVFSENYKFFDKTPEERLAILTLLHKQDLLNIKA